MVEETVTISLVFRVADADDEGQGELGEDASWEEGGFRSLFIQAAPQFALGLQAPNPRRATRPE